MPADWYVCPPDLDVAKIKWSYPVRDTRLRWQKSRRHSYSIKMIDSHDRDPLWFVTQALLICDGAFYVSGILFSELLSLWSGYDGPDLGCEWSTMRDKSVQYNELCLTWITHPFCSALLSCSAKTLSFSIICASKLTNLSDTKMYQAPSTSILHLLMHSSNMARTCSSRVTEMAGALHVSMLKTILSRKIFDSQSDIYILHLCSCTNMLHICQPIWKHDHLPLFVMFKKFEGCLPNTRLKLRRCLVMGITWGRPPRIFLSCTL